MFWDHLFEKKHRQAARDRAALFIFLGLAFSVLMISFVFALEPSGRTSVFGSPPDWRTAVPSDWLLSPGAEVKLSDSDLPSYVIGYASDGTAGVALLVWDKSLARYTVSSKVALADVNSKLRRVVTAEASVPGAGASPAARITAASDTAALGDFFVVMSNTSLRVVQMLGSDGRVRPAVFWHGLMPDGQARFELRDVNGDGTLEGVVSGQYQDLTGSGQRWKSADVYVWRNGRYEYDKELSWALTTESSLFPDPPTKPPVDAPPLKQ